MADPRGKGPSRYLWTVSRILEATGGRRLSGNPRRRFSGVGIDSRRILPGQLFIAIVGERFDGHRFVADAVEKGASGVLVERRAVRRIPLLRFRKQGIVCVSVPDTIQALGRLGAHHRHRWGGRLVAITGSNGKTTTRKMTAAVLGQGPVTLSTVGNYNNAIGLPLTLLNLCPAHEWAVVELGMNHPGEIGHLARICGPDVGVITNVAPAHLEGVGSVDGVVRAKAELLAHLKNRGTAVLNADDPNVMKIAGQATQRVCLFGRSKRASVRATAVRETRHAVRFLLHVSQTRVPVVLNTPGRFMVSNALAAAAVGHLVGLSADQIRAGLEAFVPERGRMARVPLKGGVTLIDDTYNANPGSMEAAMDTLMRLKGKKGRGFMVLGDMLELGDHSEALHRRMGRHAAHLGAFRIYVTGRFARAVASGAVEAGMGKTDIFIGEKSALFKDLIERVRPGDWILVKGSRGMAMETVVEALKTWAAKDRKRQGAGQGSNRREAV